MRIWVDSTHPAPDNSYVWCKDAREAIDLMKFVKAENSQFATPDCNRENACFINLSACDKNCVDILYWVQDNCGECQVVFHKAIENF